MRPGIKKRKQRLTRKQEQFLKRPIQSEVSCTEKDGVYTVTYSYDLKISIKPLPDTDKVIFTND